MSSLFMLNDIFLNDLNYNILDTVSMLSILSLLVTLFGVAPCLNENFHCLALFFLSCFLTALLFASLGYMEYITLYELLFVIASIILLSVSTLIQQVLYPRWLNQHRYIHGTQNNRWRVNLQYKILQDRSVAIFDNNNVYPTALKFLFPNHRLVWLTIFGVTRACIILPRQNYFKNNNLVPYHNQHLPSSFFPCYALEVSAIKYLSLRTRVEFWTGEFILHVNQDRIYRGKVRFIITRRNV